MVDQLLGVAALLFVVLFALAAAVETILELFRGALGRLGIKNLKGAYSLDDALAVAAEVAPKDGETAAKLAALQLTVGKFTSWQADKRQEVDDLIDRAGTVVGEVAALAPGADLNAKLNDLSASVSRAADLVRDQISKYERTRILILRVLSSLIGSALAVLADIDIFATVKTGMAQAGLTPLTLPTGQWYDIAWGELVAGIASASGSSYWHDKIDKVRSLKNISQQVAGVIRR